ncbi:NAD(P)H-hydrate dehydratase [Frigoribacterium sp. ACAM 257]|uniref:NAD(P)H-hydrate dehydratase n=1 Tax=Frigoribacterium sp. ACAM 257 TaxID=2508998 RepID=UPI0011B9B9C7|nr:NAD(P)H-hydrate dehydratase [Frigoribacterium sp. ACAM 257]TWX40015.1 NAD(P)H-hydrate dehydratase [Frigoribacterium sp. ACAM 257]
MSDRTEHVITPDLLREWPLPSAGDGKYSRGQVVVVGGAARTPGAAMLGALAALRVGAGRLTLAVAGSVAPHVAVALPEAGVVPLGETAAGHVVGSSLEAAASDLAGADAVLAGSGLDDADEAEALVRLLPDLVGHETIVVLDAFALGVLPRCGDTLDRLRGRLVLTPNTSEAGRLLDRDVDDLASDLLEIAARWEAVVACQSLVASPHGRLRRSGAGHPGLGTSGSGDVLAGAVAGLAARGATPAQAATWATHAHASAGDRLAVGVGPLGFLASELLAELPRVLVEVGG